MSPGICSRWRQNQFAAHAVPLALFLGLLALVPLVEREHSSAAWWRQAPEQWIYPLQILLCGAALIFWWKQFDFGRRGPAEWLWGAVFGLIGIGIWLLPCEVWHRANLAAAEEAGRVVSVNLPMVTDGPEPWWRLLGVDARAEGFDPAQSPWPGLALVLRFVRMVLIVAFVEEIFWRGFVMRKFAERDGEEWTSVPIGLAGVPPQKRAVAWAGATGLAMLAHAPIDWAAALVFFTLGFFLCCWRRSVWACVVMHGVANLILGLYAWQTGRYGLW